MSVQIQSLPEFSGPAYIRVAEVIHAAPNQLYRVRLEDNGQVQEMSTHLAMPVGAPLKVGARVLVAGQSPSIGYIIGLLDWQPPQTIRTAQGAGVRVLGQADDERIVVHDEHDQPIFEYHPASGRSVVKAPRGDLQLSAPNGRIDLNAGKGIGFTGEADVAITSGQSVRIAVGGQTQQPDQELRLDGGGIHLGVHRMDVTAGRGDIRIARAVYHGVQLKSTVDRAKMVYGKLEISAQRLWELSEYVFRSVRHLCQMQAGRLRILVNGAHHVQSERTTIIAKKDVRIDAEKINLG
jgi:hypothetical protein